jgi:mevalonate kinase
VPVTQVFAETTIIRAATDSVTIDAPDISRHYSLREAAADDPIAAIIRLTCEKIRAEPEGFAVRICSTIPVARGLGSGAAVSVATARAIADFFSRDLSARNLSARFDVEAASRTEWYRQYRHCIQSTSLFLKGQTPQTFRVARPFQIAIADTGVASPTKVVVGDVRRSWEADRATYEARFDDIGEIARGARVALERGDVTSLGSLMLKNQELLQQIGVSSEEIEKIVDAAIGAGAEGAKLSGAGRGGNVIALVDEESSDAVASAMKQVGAVRVILTQVE